MMTYWESLRYLELMIDKFLSDAKNILIRYAIKWWLWEYQILPVINDRTNWTDTFW